MKISEILIKQEKTIGERSAIRPFNPQDTEDVTRLLVISQDENNNKWVIDLPKTQKKVIEWIKDPDEGAKLYAVTGSLPHVEPSEVGRIQGEIYVYPLDPKTQQNITDANLIKTDELSRSQLFEMGYAKYPNAKDQQIASGLRQAISDYEAYVASQTSDPMTHDEDRIIFIAGVDPENTSSERVLQACGFELIGQAPYDEKEKKAGKLSNFWRLNWDKFHLIKIQKTVQLSQ